MTAGHLLQEIGPGSPCTQQMDTTACHGARKATRFWIVVNCGRVFAVYEKQRLADYIRAKGRGHIGEL